MRGLAVGFGNVFQTDHLPAYRAHGVDIVAVVDCSLPQLEMARRELPHCHIYTNIDEALRCERVDFCDISAPPYLHASTMLTCIQHCVPVICEKPFVMTRMELLHILRVAGQHKVLVFPCHTWLYAPQMQRAFALIDAGEIGEPLRLDVEIIRTHPALGTRSWNPDWRIDPSFSGGGILMDHGYHMFYLAQQLLQAFPSLLHVNSYHKTQGSEEAITLGGRFTPVSRREGAKTKTFAAELTWLAETRTTRYRLVGTQGSLLIEDDTMCVSKGDQIQSLTHAEGLTASSQHPLWFANLFQHFVSLYNKQVVFHDDLAVACYCMDAIWGAYQSMQRGGTTFLSSADWMPHF